MTKRFKFSQLAQPAVIQAPMAGGSNTPDLVAAVANAGGIGSFGFSYSKPEKIDADLKAARKLSPLGIINANLFIFPEVYSKVTLPNQSVQEMALNALSNVAVGGQQPEGNHEIPSAPFCPDVDELLEPVWVHRPNMLTFHFGIPKLIWVKRAHDLGITVGATATCVGEAEQVQAAGLDFVVEQGIEAGRHRGTFDPDGAHDEKLACEELVKRFYGMKSGSIPIVAAGGIMDGADIYRMMKAGSSAVQCGTAFLTCDEFGASKAHKAFLLGEPGRGTAYTRGFSGRWAQGIRNSFIDQMENQPTMPFPVQNIFTGPLRAKAGQTNNGEYQSLWCGLEYARTRPMPAAQLMDRLAEEHKQALESDVQSNL